MAKSAVRDADVVIIGMGPVGALATILLAKAGLRVAVVERDTEVYRLPRAVNLDGEIVRALQPTGLAQSVADLLQPVRPGERAGFANARREWMFGARLAPFGVNGWQSVNMFDQPELEGFLRDTALGLPGVHAFVGYKAEAPVDHGSSVSVQISRDHDDLTLNASYLLACDGAASTTRKALGIGWENLGYDHDWLVVDVITKPGHTMGLDTLQICDPKRICTYVCGKDPYRRWEFKLNPGETWAQMLEPETIANLIEAFTPADTYTVRRAAMYQFHAATAEAWRVGRVFLVGDAAHQTPPFLGQGMNMGMRDAINLSWKLAMIFRGDPAIDANALLDAYEAERRAHAHDMVEWAVSFGRLMEHFAAVAAAEANGETPPEADPSLQSAGYGQSREAPPLRAGVVLESQVGEDSPTGHLLTQPEVSDGVSTYRLDDRFGAGFALLSRRQDEGAINVASHRLLQRIGASIVTLQGLEEVRGHIDRGLDAADWLMLRPDRYVFGHTTSAVDVNDLVAVLAEKLPLVNHH
ncbi:MAG: bifunctional 3-(3-hydroxy-phenyl)propionate/3-hydroxycinnamic acid hydroxylase [Pseudomonadota bacterium]